MLIKDWMAKDPVTMNEDTSMIKAIHIMKERHFRRIPVVAEGKLVGMVTDRDLKEASPSKATTLDVHELYYLLAELQVQEIMSRNPISVSQDDTVEHAAQIMLEHTISGLPVVDGEDRVVGIITQSDVFRAFMHITGILQGGVQFALRLEDRPGLIKEVVDLLRARGARFVSLLSSYATSQEGYRDVYHPGQEPAPGGGGPGQGGIGRPLRASLRHPGKVRGGLNHRRGRLRPICRQRVAQVFNLCRRVLWPAAGLAGSGGFCRGLALFGSFLPLHFPVIGCLDLEQQLLEGAGLHEVIVAPQPVDLHGRVHGGVAA